METSIQVLFAVNFFVLGLSHNRAGLTTTNAVRLRVGVR